MARKQSSLPIKLGGLGIKLASEVALPGYLSSTYAIKSIVQSLIPDLIKENQKIFQDRKYLLGLDQ